MPQDKHLCHLPLEQISEGFYMKYSVMPENISSFVVGRTRSECGLPMAVYKKEE